MFPLLTYVLPHLDKERDGESPYCYVLHVYMYKQKYWTGFFKCRTTSIAVLKWRMTNGAVTVHNMTYKYTCTHVVRPHQQCQMQWVYAEWMAEDSRLVWWYQMCIFQPAMMPPMLLQLVCLSQSESCHPLSMQQRLSQFARNHSRVSIDQQWRCMSLLTGQSSLEGPRGREWHWDWGQGTL